MKAIIHHQPEIKIIPGNDGAAPDRAGGEMRANQQYDNKKSSASTATAAGIC
jgi:hypothetical protein